MSRSLRLRAAVQALREKHSIPLLTALAGAILFSATLVAEQQAASAGGAGSAPAVAPCSPMVEIVKTGIWPLIAFIIALVYRQPLGQFLQAIRRALLEELALQQERAG